MEDKGLLDRVPEVQSPQNLKHSISMTFLMDHDHGDNQIIMMIMIMMVMMMMIMMIMIMMIMMMMIMIMIIIMMIIMMMMMIM